MKTRHLVVGQRVIVTDNKPDPMIANRSTSMSAGYEAVIIDRTRRRSKGIDRYEYKLEFTEDIPHIDSFQRMWYQESQLSTDIEGVRARLDSEGFTRWAGFKFKRGDIVVGTDGFLSGRIGEIVSELVSNDHVLYYVQLNGGGIYAVREELIALAFDDDGYSEFIMEYE